MTSIMKSITTRKQIFWHYGWVIVAFTLLMQAVSVGILIYCFALFVVPWLEEFAVSRSDVMLCILGFQVMLGLFSPFIGRLFDTFSPRSIVLMGTLVLASGLVLLSMANAFWQIVLLYVLLLPLGMLMTGSLVSMTLVTRWFHEKRGLAIGVSALGTSLGGFLFPLLVGQLLETASWRETVFVLAVVAGVLVVPLAWLLLKRLPPQLPGASVDQDVQDVSARIWTVAEILGCQAFWIIVMLFVAFSMTFGAVQHNLGVFAKDLGFSPQQAAVLVSLISVSMLVGKLFFGAMADRLSYPALFRVAALNLSLALIVFQGSPGLLQIKCGVIMLGLAAGGILPLSGIIISNKFGVASFGKVLGLYRMFLVVGAIGPTLAAWLFDLTGSYDIAFRIFLILLLPSFVLVSSLGERSLSESPVRP